MRKTKLNPIGKKKQTSLKRCGIKAYSTFANKNNKGLMRSPLKKLGGKKRAELKAETETRKKLCRRAGGTWINVNNLVGGYCKDGLCELCGKPANWMSEFKLEPHEENHRGNGGKLTMENSKMVCRPCHDKEHGK